ncbi:ATP-binding cassette domain-containing protein [Actinacidiphila paucisporea]|uniref:Peptide/nickel transport system ATP-binding protein n=1 Tax=Actinacidiphila paucisporea TaxID=310782 RepID=A0A1M7PT35_9ACTN|nr:ABC transporter ATP-binding protein [Actinacidiphila paucisporea]SHN20612.1 peptide/nickel transport system ATP-binding protein [Actinacidiphila paucisporea]
MLTVEALSVEYALPDGPLRAVDEVSFTLASGEALVLLGESGSGKSTVARACLGMAGRGARTRGRVLLDGDDLLTADERTLSRIRGRRIGYVPQDPSGYLDPLRRIGPQIAGMLRRHRAAAGRRAAAAAVPGLLAAAGVPDPERVARAFPHELSGGLRQRAAVALAVSCGPRLLVADEPTTALDALVRAQVLDLLRALCAERDLALLLVTHDLAAAHRIGGRVAVLRDGRLVRTGPAAEVLAGYPHPVDVPAARPGARR